MKRRKPIVSIVAGGVMSRKFLPPIVISDIIVGVDRGALWLIERGIVPHVAMGDFDSVTKDEFARIKKYIQKVLTYPNRKDETDLELALKYAARLNPQEIVIYGALGRRLDHTAAALQLLEKQHRQKAAVRLRDDQNEATMITGKHELQKVGYQYTSILPVTKSATVTLQGFVYDVSRKIFSRGSTIGISNEIKGKSATITVHKGIILVIHSRD